MRFTGYVLKKALQQSYVPENYSVSLLAYNLNTRSLGEFILNAIEGLKMTNTRDYYIVFERTHRPETNVTSIPACHGNFC
jgi:hypothetical protein